MVENVFEQGGVLEVVREGRREGYLKGGGGINKTGVKFTQFVNSEEQKQLKTS